LVGSKIECAFAAESGLEQFFATYPDEYRLYYERRDGQYDKGTEQKVRVRDAATVLRSYSSIFMETPHTATKNYKSIRDEIGSSIFADGHKYVAYYYASYSWFLLEDFYRNKTIDPIYKSARYHILMAVNLLIDSGPKLFGNSKEIEKRSNKALEVLWNVQLPRMYSNERSN